MTNTQREKNTRKYIEKCEGSFPVSEVDNLKLETNGHEGLVKRFNRVVGHWSSHARETRLPKGREKMAKSPYLAKDKMGGHAF
jgi:hypothetical protein